MNILIFTYSVTRNAGGVFDAVRDLFTNKAFGGHDLKVFSFMDEHVEEDLPTWGDVCVKLFKAGPMLFSRKARKAVLAENADILHMEALWRYPQLFMTAWKRRKKSPVVCSPHGMLDPYILQNQGKLKRLVSKLFLQKSLDAVDCYHALCQKELEDIRSYGLKQPVAVIPNGINMPDPNLHFEKQDAKKHLLYLGRLHRKKGVDLLLNAVANILESNSGLLDNWQIDLVGWDHENCKAELEKIVADRHLENRVVFHGGLFGEDKQRMLATADGYILPSHGEGLPMTVLEAWAWKLPVIMTPECHLPEGYDADAALKIEDNVKSVEQGLVKFLTLGDEERKQIGLNGYELVKRDFTWDVSAQKMLQVYDWLLGKADKPTFVHLVKTNNGGGNSSPIR